MGLVCYPLTSQLSPLVRKLDKPLVELDRRRPTRSNCPRVVVVGCSVYGNGNEFDGPHRIPLSYKEVDDYDVILDRVGERVRSNIGAVRAYVP